MYTKRASSVFFRSRRFFTTTSPLVSVQLTSPGSSESTTRIIPVGKNETNFPNISNPDNSPFLENHFPTSEGSTALLFNPNSSPEKELLIRCGDKAETSSLRSMIFNSLRALQARKISNAFLNLSDLEIDYSNQALVDHVARTAILTGYEFNRYKKPDPQKQLFQRLDLCVEKPDEYQATLNLATASASGALVARDLSNEQADVATPEYLEKVATSIAKDSDAFELQVVKGDEVELLGLNMLHAVGQGATVGPRLILLDYNPTKSQDAPIVFLGKGITFDSGGLNLKPTGFMETMHMDMSGAAAVLGAASVVKQLDVQKRILFVVAAAENAINEKAYKPGCILKSFSGKTVEVGNTDAEGRLVLADALSFVQDRYKPKQIIDLATLTGACVVALGEYGAGLFGNSERLSSHIRTAGSAVEERCWPMPIFPEHLAELKSSFADVKSIGEGRYGGASTAAAFLQKFIDDGVEWVHLDIAGPAMYSKPRDYMPKGGTGFGVQTLLEFLRE